MKRYFVSPDGANGFMEWHVMRRVDDNASVATGLAFSGTDDIGEEKAEELAEKVAKVMNQEADIIFKAWRDDANLELSMIDMGPFEDES